MQLTYLVQPDPFAGRAEAVADYIPSALDTSSDLESKWSKPSAGTMLGVQEVGRPIQGIVVKPNTAAFAQVIGKDGKPRSLLNQLGTPRDWADGEEVSALTHDRVWTDWFLQTVREERTEKTQLLETFGDTYLFAFGQKPRTLVFQGTLMNTQDFNWRATFWENWDAEFRATQLIKNEARMYISWDDVLVEGYPINAVAHQVADSPNAMVFSLVFFVTNYVSLAKRSKWANERQQAIPLASFRDRVPQSQDGELVGTTLGQDIVRLTGLTGVRTLAGLAGQAAGGSGIAADLARLAVNYGGGLAAGALLSATSMDQLQNMLAYETARFTRQVSSTLLYGGAAKAGFSVRDVNMWFGYAAMLARRAADIVLAQHPSDRMLQQSDRLPGSVDELLQQMGFAVEEALRARPDAIATTQPALPVAAPTPVPMVAPIDFSSFTAIPGPA